MYDAYHIKETLVTEAQALPKGVRARSKENNRQKILKSAKALFRDRGFEAATLRDIAKEAGLSTGAVFANFSDKAEIFLKVVEEETAQVIGAMIDAHDETLGLSERISHQIMQAYEVAEADIKLILSAFVMNWAEPDQGLTNISRLSQLLREVIYETLNDAVSKGELPKDADIQSASDMLEDLALANIRRAHQDGHDLRSEAERVIFQVNLIVSGLKSTLKAA
jgi:AcrR family transcriptional regulator